MKTIRDMSRIQRMDSMSVMVAATRISAAREPGSWDAARRADPWSGVEEGGLVYNHLSVALDERIEV